MGIVTHQHRLLSPDRSRGNTSQKNAMSKETKQLIIECPRCKTKVVWDQSPFHPFCSERCQLIDLGDWASEKHRIAGEELPTDDEDEKN